MIVKKDKDKWLVDCRSMEQGKSIGCRKYFNSLEDATSFMVDYLEEKSKLKFAEIESIAIFDNHGALIFLKDKNGETSVISKE